MESTAHSKFFQRGRINAKDLSQQNLEFIVDYATRYAIPKTLPSEEIVRKIFEGGREFIPILPNHTWALEDDCIVLTERREPPKFPRYQCSLPDTLHQGNAFPDPPQDTYSRSPSPTSDDPAEDSPRPASRLPLVYPPLGPGSDPLPDDWLQQMLEEYQEDHEKVVSDLQNLVEEVEIVSYETVRVMSKIRKEQADTWRLLDTIKEVCGQEFLDKLLRDVHATTRYEINRKQSASGSPSRSVLPTAVDENGGRIRSKRFTRDKQIFSRSGGTALPLNDVLPTRKQATVSPQPSNSQVRTFSSTDSPFEASIAQEFPAPVVSHPAPALESNRTDALSAVTGVNTSIEPPVPAQALRGSTKRSRPTSTDNTPDDANSRSKRRKASLSVNVGRVTQESGSTSVLPTTSNSSVIPIIPSDPAKAPSMMSNHPSSSHPSQRPDEAFDLWASRPRDMGHMPVGAATRPTDPNSASASASSSTPSTTANEPRGPAEHVNLWTAKLPRIPELISSERSPSYNPVDPSQPTTELNPLDGEFAGTTSLGPEPAGTSTILPIASSSQPSASSSQPTATLSQPTASSNQPTASSSQSQPAERRKPTPLKRASERLMMKSDGTLEIINIDTPERIAAGEELVRDAQRRGHRFTLAQIAEQCAPRYPFLFAGKRQDDYHSICPPSPRAGWGHD